MHENEATWYQEKRTWPHWFEPSESWALALQTIEGALGGLMGFSEIRLDNGSTRWTCN